MSDHPSDLTHGLIRSQELFEELRRDVAIGYEALEAAPESQYLRRSLVRAIFCFIEAGIEVVKIEIRSTIRSNLYSGSAWPTLSEKEEELLGGWHLVPPPVARFIALEANVKRTFRLAAKVWRADFKLATSGAEFRAFITAKEARNRLTHPRTFYEIEVTDRDMHLHTVAGMWFQAELRRLFTARLHAMALELSPADQEQFLKNCGL